MSDPNQGPWDDATVHDDPHASDSDQLDGEDPPTTRATLAQQVRIRAASRPVPTAARGPSTTLPPPVSPERLPAGPPAPTPVAPAPTPKAVTGGVVVVATGSDAERVRRLCHAAGLLVPVVASRGAVTEPARIVTIGEPALPVPPSIAYVARGALADEDLLDLLRALVAERTVVDPPTLDAADARIREHVDRITVLAERDAIEHQLREAITQLVHADRAHVHFQHAAAGIVGWCALTGRAVSASPAGDDPRYLTALDDPDGKAQSRVLVQPVLGADRRTHAILVAARRWRRTDFTDADRAALAQLAAQLAPAIERLAAASASVNGTRTTLPGVAAARPPTDPATQSALLGAPPRAAHDSRPPPVKAARAPSAPPVPPAPASEPPEPAPRPVAAPTSTSSPPVVRATRRTGDADDPLDVAVVATADDDIARVRRIARKARLEVSILARAEDAPPYYRIVTLGEAWTPDTDVRVAYAARSTIADDQLSELLVGLSHDRAPAPLVAAKPQSSSEARRVQAAFDSSRRLATAPDLAAAETLATAAVRELVDADRAYLLYYAHEDGSLWSESRRHARGDDRRAIAGVVGWAARTGRAVNVPRASADPRWLGPLDDPDGDMHSQLLVQPLVAADRRVLGVIVAARRTKRPPFSELDASVLERFAGLASPLVEQLQLAAATQQLLRESSAPHDVPALDSPVQALLRRARALPRWSYAAGGAVLALAIVALAQC